MQINFANCFTDISAYNGTINNSNRSSTSSIESISQSNRKFNTQQSIVEVHSPPHDIILDIIPGKLIIPPTITPIATLSPTELFTSKSTPILPELESAPILSTSKSAPTLSILKSAPVLSSVKSTPVSSTLANSSMMPPMPPPLPLPPPSTPIGSISLLQPQKSLPSTFMFNKVGTFKNNFSNGEYITSDINKKIDLIIPFIFVKTRLYL